MRPFSHEPLDLNNTTIRLLRLRRTHVKAIICELIHVPLAVDHVCLSYMWGSDVPGYTIRINGGAFKVRENLFQFLRIAKRLNISDWLWIDAICINQNDIEERNHQVQQMGAIYRQAKHVLIYPGRLPWSSQIVHKSKRLQEKIWDRYEDLSRSRSLLSPFFFWLGWMGELPRSLAVEPRTLPYWNRLWILQELALAKLRFVVTDARLLSWKQFESTYAYFNSAGFPHPLAPSVWELCGSDVGRHTRTLEEQIVKFASSECEDPRNHVYGLIGLATPEPSLSVDCRIDRCSLFLAVIKESVGGAVIKNTFADVARSMPGVLTLMNALAHSLRLELAYVCWTCNAMFTSTLMDLRLAIIHRIYEYAHPDMINTEALEYSDSGTRPDLARQLESISTVWILSELDSPKRNEPAPVEPYLRCKLCSLDDPLHLYGFSLAGIEAISGRGTIEPRIFFRWTREILTRERLRRHSPLRHEAILTSTRFLRTHKN